MPDFKKILFIVFPALLGALVFPVVQFAFELNTRPEDKFLTISYYSNTGSPEQIEREATAPLENALAQIPEIKSISSRSITGAGSIQVQFKPGADIAFKKFEIASLIRRVYRNLKINISYPLMESRSWSDAAEQPMLTATISSPAALSELRKVINDNFIIAISQVPGISEVTIIDDVSPEVVIEYDAYKLRAAHLSRDQLIQAISSKAGSFFLGTTNTASREFFPIKLSGIDNFAELENITVSPAGSIRLADVANVYQSERPPQNLLRINGLNSLAIGIYADRNSNALYVSKDLKKRLDEIEKELPANFHLQLVKDETAFLRDHFYHRLYTLIVSVVALSILLFAWYKKYKIVLILLITQLVGFLITLYTTYLCAVTLDLNAISSLNISLVSSIVFSIVILESVRKRYNPTVIMIFALLVMLLCFCAFNLLPSKKNEIYAGIYRVTSIHILISALTSIVFIPAAYNVMGFTGQPAARIAPGSFRGFYLATLRQLSARPGILVTLVLLCFGTPIFLLPSKIDGQEWYNRSFGSKTYQEKIRPLTDKMLGGMLRIFWSKASDGTLQHPSRNRTQLVIEGALENVGTNENLSNIVKPIEDYLSAVEGVDQFITRISAGKFVSITIQFKESHEKGALPFTLKSILTARSVQLSGVEWNVYGLGQGFSTSGNSKAPGFDIRMKGYNLLELEGYVKALQNRLLSHKRINEVLIDYNEYGNEKSMYRLSVGENLGGVGINDNVIGSLLNDQLDTDKQDLSFRMFNRPVRLKEKHSELTSLYDVLNSTYYSGDRAFKFPSGSTLLSPETVNEILKEERQYVKTISFFYNGDYRFGKKYLDDLLIEVNNELRPGFRAESVEESYAFNITSGGIFVFLLYVLAVYLIGVMAFESLLAPFYILFSMLTSYLGIFLVFSITDARIDNGAFVSLFFVGAITASAAFFMLLRSQDHPEPYAALKTPGTILLIISAASLVLLAISIAYADEYFWFSFSIGSLGGLVSSLIALCLFLPSLVSFGKGALFPYKRV